MSASALVPQASLNRCPLHRPTGQRWGIVLAGGEGARMQAFVERWLGEPRPKQYCTFAGTRSMLRHTVDRARAVLPEEHLVTVVGKGHRRFLGEAGVDTLPGRVIEQPENLGTAPGIFLPTAYALSEDPEATLVILPSDHFVYPEHRFCEHLKRAVRWAEVLPDRLVLVGAKPERAETDYGWIALDAHPASLADRDKEQGAPAKVARFCEKPDAGEAEVLLRQGCLWNTMIMAVKAKTLWALGREHLPAMTEALEAFLGTLRAVRRGHVRPAHERKALQALYAQLAPVDFSRHLVQRVPERTRVLPLVGVQWCDWGRPERVAETLAAIGHRPLFEEAPHEDRTGDGREDRRLPAQRKARPIPSARGASAPTPAVAHILGVGE